MYVLYYRYIVIIFFFFFFNRRQVDKFILIIIVNEIKSEITKRSAVAKPTAKVMTQRWLIFTCRVCCLNIETSTANDYVSKNRQQFYLKFFSNISAIKSRFEKIILRLF